MKKCQYIQGKKYEKQRNSEKMWRFDDFVGTSEHRVIGIKTEFKQLSFSGRASVYAPLKGHTEITEITEKIIF